METGDADNAVVAVVSGGTADGVGSHMRGMGGKTRAHRPARRHARRLHPAGALYGGLPGYGLGAGARGPRCCLDLAAHLAVRGLTRHWWWRDS